MFQAVGVAEPPPEVGDPVEVVVQEAFLLESDRIGGGVRRDAWVAVAVAADPGAESEERGHSPVSVGIDPAQARFDGPIDPGNDLQQVLLDHAEPLLDLVLDGRPRVADGVGQPEGLDLLGDRGDGPLAVDRDDHGVFQAVELASDARQFLQDRSPSSLAGVRGEDRADQGPIEVLGDLVRVNPPVAKLPEGRLGALVDPGRVGLPGMGADRANPGLLLGQVGQIKIDAERPDQRPEVRQTQFPQPVAEPPGRLGRRVGPEVFRRRADLLDQRERILARQAANRLTKQPAEKARDVAAESFPGGLGSAWRLRLCSAS